MQRAVLTLPPGAACLLGLAGQSFHPHGGTGWHARRVNRAARVDMMWLHRLLRLNLGRGFY
eukprot:6414656-Prymnesium_polylepis.1